MFHRKREVISLSVDESRCIGCENCVARCRRKVFDMRYSIECYAWAKYPMDCVGCGKCLNVCPTGAIKLVTN